MSDIRNQRPARQFVRHEGLPREIGPRPVHGTAARRAVQDRGAETRTKLIAAGLDIFGRQGFESATTRQIAKAAGANLAAIVYHFGSKEGLYVAVAEDVIARLAEKIGGQIRDVAARIEGADVAAARAMLHGVIATLVEASTGEGEEAARWTRFILREQLDPSPAFPVIHEFMGRIHELVSRLIAIALHTDAGALETKVMALTLIGQVLGFRVARPLVLRGLGIAAIGSDERALIRRIVSGNVDAILDRAVTLSAG